MWKFGKVISRLRSWIFSKLAAAEDSRVATPHPDIAEAAGIPEPSKERRIKLIEEEPKPAWCLVGNVVEKHPFGQDKQILQGTKHFVAGAKVYCLPAQWGDGFDQIIVVRLARKPRRLITVVTHANYVENWRAKVVYQPAVLKRLHQGFNGFSRQWKSKDEVDGWVAELQKRERFLKDSSHS